MGTGEPLARIPLRRFDVRHAFGEGPRGAFHPEVPPEPTRARAVRARPRTANTRIARDHRTENGAPAPEPGWQRPRRRPAGTARPDRETAERVHGAGGGHGLAHHPGRPGPRGRLTANGHSPPLP